MKLIFKLVLYCVIGLLLCLYIFKKGEELILRNLNLPDTISNNKEKDYNIIKEFAKGMKTKDYLHILAHESKLLDKSSEKYKKIDYNFEKTLKYSEIEDMIFRLNHSDAVETEIIGSSADSRDIYSISIGFGEKIFLIDAGVHAREIANPMYIMKFIIDLVNKYEKRNKEVIDLLNNIKIVAIPNVNPDGYEAVLFGVDMIRNKDLYIYKNRKNIDFESYKANANGVDLNRNFPSQHGGLFYKDFLIDKTVSTQPSTGVKDYYPGTRLGSEPETKALMYWLNKYINKAYAYIDVHSAGRVIYSGKPNLSNEYNIASLKLAYLVSDINKYEAFDQYDEEVGYGNDGTVTDYASEIISGFKFSYKTGRLGGSSYINPDFKISSTGIITLETLNKYSYDLETIKKEYYDKKLEDVFFSLIKRYK